MEKYRREGSVDRLQTGLGATVRGARAGCARAALPPLPGLGAAQGWGLCREQGLQPSPRLRGFCPHSRPTAGLMVQTGCRICIWVRGCRVAGEQQEGVNV